MRRTIHAWAAVFTLGAAAGAGGQVVISQVDGNGGLGVDLYDRDFVELFNRGTTPVDLAGWSLQIFGDSAGSTATTPFTPSWDVVPLSGVIMPGQYFLVVPSLQRGTQGVLVTTPVLPPADFLGSVYNQSMLVNNNAVALMSTTTPIPAGQCPSGPNLIDLFRIGYPIALCYEGSGPGGPATSGTSVFAAALRNGAGCDDTNSSPTDLTGGVAPAPRNSDANGFVTTVVSPSLVTFGIGGMVTLTAVRGTAPCNPLSGALTAATADLSVFGQASNQSLFDDGAHGDGGSGDGTFGYQFAVGPAQAVGAPIIPIVASSGATSVPVSARLRIFPAPATNDLCANAINIMDAGGINIAANGPYSTIVNTRQAGADQDSGITAASTCNADTETKFSVWYAFTPPVGGAVRVTERSSEDIISAIYPSCAAMFSSVCLQREDGGFPVAAGTSYVLQIGRETGAGGVPEVPLDLTFTFVPTSTAVPNDTPCAAETISAFPFSAQPYAPAATDETSPLVNVTCDATANTSARHGVWYTFVAPSNGALEIFEFEPLNSTTFAVLSGACAAPAVVGCANETTSGTLFTGLAGGTAYLLLASYNPAITTSSPSQPYNFTVNFLATPANDLCTGAVDLNITGLPYAETVRARAANGDAGVPTTTGASGVNTCTATLGTRPNGVWYGYSTGPSASGTLRVADFSSNDVFYNVFNVCGDAAVQCYGAFTNDDIFIQLAPSTTYFILVGMQTTTATAASNYDLAFTLYPAPANDLPCGATFVNTPTFNDVVAGPSATADVDLSCNYNIPAQSTTGYGVWYRFLTTSPKQLTVHENASDVLVYGLFTGPNCGALSEIDCKMGSNGALTTDNTAYFNLSAGTEYWLLIGKISNSQPFGFYNLDFTLDDAKGACCVGANCVIATQATCAGIWRGAFTYCAETPNYQDTVAEAIPDHVGGNPGTPGVLTKTITIADSGTVSDLRVLLELNHARTGDLIVTLVAPGGASAELMRRIDDDDDAVCPNNGSQGRLTDLGAIYIFDDQSYNPFGPGIRAAAKYFDFTGLVVPSGHYKPSSCDSEILALSPPFIGASITGTWTLTVSDRQSSSTGTVTRWGLIINGGVGGACSCRADFNGSGPPPTVQDIFDFLAAYFSNHPSADFNGSGAISVQDIFDFLGAYFGGC